MGYYDPSQPPPTLTYRCQADNTRATGGVYAKTAGSCVNHDTCTADPCLNQAGANALNTCLDDSPPEVSHTCTCGEANYASILEGTKCAVQCNAHTIGDATNNLGVIGRAGGGNGACTSGTNRLTAAGNGYGNPGSACDIKCDTNYVPQTATLSCDSNANDDGSTDPVGMLVCVACSTINAGDPGTCITCSSGSQCDTRTCPAGYYDDGGSCAACHASCGGTSGTCDGGGNSECTNQADGGTDPRCAPGYVDNVGVCDGE